MDHYAYLQTFMHIHEKHRTFADNHKHSCTFANIHGFREHTNTTRTLPQNLYTPCALFVRVTLRKSNTHTQREQLNLNERYRLVDAVVECNLRLVQRKPHSEQMRAMQN